MLSDKPTEIGFNNDYVSVFLSSCDVNVQHVFRTTDCNILNSILHETFS
jgi:hypothetical protein